MRSVLFPLLLFAAALISSSDAETKQIKKLKEAKDRAIIASLKEQTRDSELRETLKRLADGSADLYALPTEDLLLISEKCLAAVRRRVEAGHVVEVKETAIKKPKKKKQVVTVETDKDEAVIDGEAADGAGEEEEEEEEVEEEHDDVIDSLVAKAEELKSVPTEELFMHAEIMLQALEGGGWRDSGKWPLHEIMLLKVIDEDEIPVTCQLPQITYDCITDLSPEQRGAMSDSRHKLHGELGNYLYAVRQRLDCQSDYEYEIADEKGEKEPSPLVLKPVHKLKENCEEVPEIVTVAREETTKDGKMKVYGPAKFTAFDGYDFEMWTALDENDNGDESPKECASEKKDVTVVIGSAEDSYTTALYALERVLLHRETVLIKHHSLRSYLFNPYYIILGSLIREGYIQQVLDKDIPRRTKFLSHPSVGRVHVAGSRETTTDVIKQLESSRPSLSGEEIKTMVTHDDASVGPIIVSPGQYSDAELKRLIEIISMSKKLYGGCDVGAPQVIVLPQDWPQRKFFKEKLELGLKNYSPSPSYCSGAMERKNDLFETYKALGEKRAVIMTPRNEEIPVDQHVALVDCGSFGEADFDGTALQAPVNTLAIAYVELPGGKSASKWLQNIAIPFVNNKDVIYGSVSALLATPTSQPKNVTDAAVASLQYGNIAVNAPPSLAIPYLPVIGGVTGSYPVSKESQGFIGNVYGFPKPVKAVLYGPPLDANPMQSKKSLT